MPIFSVKSSPKPCDMSAPGSSYCRQYCDDRNAAPAYDGAVSQLHVVFGKQRENFCFEYGLRSVALTPSIAPPVFVRSVPGCWNLSPSSVADSTPTQRQRLVNEEINRQVNFAVHITSSRSISTKSCVAFSLNFLRYRPPDLPEYASYGCVRTAPVAGGHAVIPATVPGQRVVLRYRRLVSSPYFERV